MAADAKRVRGVDGSKADITFEDAADNAVKVAVERQAETAGRKVGSLPTMFVRCDGREKKNAGWRKAG